MNKIVKLNNKTSLEKIQEFESYIGYELPDKYKIFLLDCNGGYPELSSFKISDQEGESLVNKFYGIEDDDCNLKDVYDCLEDILPEQFVSIADDPGGNEVCIGLDDEYRGKIYFWFHDRFCVNAMDNMYLISDDFDEFYNNLYD